MIFLIEYDREQGKILDLQTFSTSDRKYAQRERLKRELDRTQHGLVREIVLLEASDRETLERTHRRYFKSARDILVESKGEYPSESP